VIHNLIIGISPHPEKFWINLETQNLLGGAKFLGDVNQTIEIKFENLLRNPFDYDDPETVLHVKTLRYVVDSRLPEMVNIDDIDKLVIHRVCDPSTFEMPYEKYWLYFPATNALATERHLPADKKIFETSPIFLAIVFK
jgi:hypothetical protein